MEGLLYWQRPENLDPAKAGACFNLPQKQRASLGGERARQLLAVLDAGGYFIEVEEASRDPMYVDPAGRPRYQPFAELPQVYLERVGDQWLWSKTTVDAIPTLYGATFVFDVNALVRVLPHWARVPLLGVTLWQIVGLFIIIFIGVLFRVFVRLLVVTWVQRLMRRLEVTWGAEALSRVGRPIGTAVAAGVVGLLLPLLSFTIRLSQIANIAVRVVVVFNVVWAVYRMVDLFGVWLTKRADRTHTKLDDQLVPLVSKALKLFVVAMGAVFILQNLRVDVAGLLAGLGLGGLAFALAAKDTVANLFGSATIFADRPFQVGDWVAVGDQEGTVEGVGFRSTRIRTFYNSLVTVPNSKVSDSIIDNYGERKYRRYKGYLDITYDTTPEQIQAFVEGIRAIVQANPYMRKDYYHVYFNDYGPASLKILVYVFFVVPAWSDELRERHNFLLEIMRLARQLGVEFAFPTQTIHLASAVTAEPAAERRVPSTQELSSTVHAFGPGGEQARPAGPKITEGYLASE